MRKLIMMAIFLVALIFTVAFAAFNMSPVNVDYYFGTLTLPLAVLLVIAVLIGMVLGVVAILFNSLKLRYENRRLSQKLALSEQEINSLRILPIKDSH